MITFEQSRYSVPHTLMGELVWVRGTDTEVVIVHVGDTGPVEVTRHKLTRPGTPAITDAHFPPASVGALERVIRPGNKAEVEFLALGAGAARWLKEAAAAGTGKIRHKMERAVTLATVLGIGEVDKGLGAAAVHQRFTHLDLISIVNTGGGANPTTGTTHTVTDQGQWLSQGTGGWANFGTAPAATTDEDLEGATMNASTMTPALSDAAIENLIVLMHTTRMPHARAVVADVLATAKAQRWDPTEVVRVLLEAEATGRNASMLAIATNAPASRRGRPSRSGTRPCPASRRQQRRSCKPWNGVRRRENLIACGPSGTGKTLLLEALGQQAEHGRPRHSHAPAPDR